MTPRFLIQVQAIVDITTNSSSELFVITKNIAEDVIVDALNAIVDEAGLCGDYYHYFQKPIIMGKDDIEIFKHIVRNEQSKYSYYINADNITSDYLIIVDGLVEDLPNQITRLFLEKFDAISIHTG